MYGLVVIGDDLSSHVAAAIASTKGIKTALISERGFRNSCFAGDLAFDIDCTPFTGFGENQVCLSLLKELEISLELKLLNPAYQIILPDNRIDIFNDKDHLINEITREFPELSREIKSFYDAVEKNAAVMEKWFYHHPYIQPHGYKDYMDYFKLVPYLIRSNFNQRKLNRLVSRNPAFQKIMEAQKILLSYKSNSQNALFSDYLYCAPLRGIYTPEMGRQSFFESLIKKIELPHGSYISKCEVISVEKGKQISITYMDKDGVASKIEADNLIVSTKWQNMRLIIDRKKKLNIADFIRPTKISHYPFTIHLGVKAGCLPEKMTKHVAVISDVNKDIHDDNLIILESVASDITGTSSKVALSATVLLPDTEDAWSKDNLRTTADSIIERLGYFLPFLKENIEFFDIEESVDISRKQRDIINPQYHIRSSFITGFAAKNNKTRFGNIYLTGASLLADAGFEGEVISGINAAGRVTGKRK